MENLDLQKLAIHDGGSSGGIQANPPKNGALPNGGAFDGDESHGTIHL